VVEEAELKAEINKMLQRAQADELQRQEQQGFGNPSIFFYHLKRILLHFVAS